MYFTLLFPATRFGFFFRSHLQVELYFLKKAMCTVLIPLWIARSRITCLKYCKIKINVVQ